MHKNEFMGEMVNNIWLAWKLACILKTYRKCNPTVDLSKFTSNLKILSGVTLFKIILGVTWTQSIYFTLFVYQLLKG